LNKSYYVDFLFEDLNLIIELDGKQHEKTKEKDTIRDEFLKRVYNLNIVRITHKEYKTKSRIDEIKRLLML
jgi:very-short-patch-repair endonuclease